jgi:hypothetical protein
MPDAGAPLLRAEEVLAIARQLDETVRALRSVVVDLVVDAHDRGATWDEIGAVFDVSRQAAHERFGPNARTLARARRSAERLGHR